LINSNIGKWGGSISNLSQYKFYMIRVKLETFSKNILKCEKLNSDKINNENKIKYLTFVIV